MGYLNWKSGYDNHPETVVEGFEDCAYSGYDAIAQAIGNELGDKKVLTVDCYPGVDESELLLALTKRLEPNTVVLSEDIFYDGDRLTELMQPYLTDDRVRGVLYRGSIRSFIDPVSLRLAQDKVRQCEKAVLVFGFGAALVARGDILVYADMARWEIQCRYRRGMSNYKQHNPSEDILKKYKRGFFVEWRIADRHKRDYYEQMDFYLDTNTPGQPAMVTGQALRAGLLKLTAAPFRLVPYFDPGVWGGQWMKEVCAPDAQADNFAWSFDGVPEENSVLLRYGAVCIQSPAMNLTQFLPRAFLGERTFARFGAEFPIRFDLLDTMGGQNLSLQVHPDTEYIRSQFGMVYTQDESYYILDCGDEGGVYLGLKEGVDHLEMIDALEQAQAGKTGFDAQAYVNFFPAHKHDHFLIPAGTIHCASANCMVLEISATPFIFTFKLWDWDRVGLDGLPRPIHLEDGKKVIRFDRTTQWVEHELINRFETIEQTENSSVVRTGLHALEFIETQVITSTVRTMFQANGEFAMLNLVDGKEVVVESPSGAFAPYTVHYAETFIIPASAGDYTIRPGVAGSAYRVLKAHVRF